MKYFFCLHPFLVASSFMLNAMEKLEKPTVPDQVEMACSYINSYYNQNINHELVALTHTTNPNELLQNTANFYQSQLLQQNWFSYAKKPIINTKKTWSYLQLACHNAQSLFASTPEKKQHPSWPIISISYDWQEQIEKIEYIKKWLERTQIYMEASDKTHHILINKIENLSTNIMLLNNAINTVQSQKEINPAQSTLKSCLKTKNNNNKKNVSICIE